MVKPDSADSDAQAAEPARALIGLLAFGNDLFEAGLRAVAVENGVGLSDRRLIHRAAGEQIVVAHLGVERGKNLIEVTRRRFLRRGLAGIVERKRALCPLIDCCTEAAGGADLGQRRLGDASVVPTVVAVLL